MKKVNWIVRSFLTLYLPTSKNYVLNGIVHPRVKEEISEKDHKRRTQEYESDVC